MNLWRIPTQRAKATVVPESSMESRRPDDDKRPATMNGSWRSPPQAMFDVLGIGAIQIIETTVACMKTREQLNQRLEELEKSLPRLLEQTRGAERLGTFAYEASTISDAAGPDDREHVRLRIHHLIEKYGLDRSYRTFQAPQEERVAA